MTSKSDLKEVIGFDDRLMMFLLMPVVAFLVPILFFKEDLSDGLWAYLPKFSVSLVYTIIYWLSVRAIFIYNRRKYPNHKDTSRRIITTVLMVIVVFFIICTLLGKLHVSLNNMSSDSKLREFDFQVASFMIIALVSSIYESIFLYGRWKQALVETERLRRENVESQLEGLRNQVNPHFLFNSLNTLIYIIPEDPPRAVRFVQMLSKVYRYILEIRDKKLISLEEELQFLEAYSFLLKERFGEHLNIRIQVPEAERNAQIVPLSLQMLFENAIKHNIISAEKPLTIELFTEAGQIVVQNNLQRKRQTGASTKVGLNNIRDRYTFFSDRLPEIQESPERFTVKLPLLFAPA